MLHEKTELTLKNFIIIFSFLFFLIPYNSFSQNKKVDSLKRVLTITYTDTSRIKILNTLFAELIDTSPDDALKYGEQALNLSLKTKNSYGLINTLYIHGRYYSSKNEISKSLEYFNKAYELASVSGNKKSVASSLQAIGAIYSHKCDYYTALEYLINSLKIYQSINHKNGIANSCLNIGNIYYYLNEFDKFLEYYNKALNLYLEKGDDKGVAVVLLNIGRYYSRKKEDYKTAEYYIQNSLLVYNKLNHKNGIIGCYDELGRISYKVKQYSRCLEYCTNAINLAEEAGDSVELIGAYNTIGDMYFEQGNYSEALYYLDKALNLINIIKEISNLQLKGLYESLSDTYEKTGDFEHAFKYHKLFLQVKDSIFNEDNRIQVNNLKTKYETELMENEIINLTSEKEIKDLKLNKSRNIILFVIIAAALILILAAVLYNRYLLKLKTGRVLTKKNNQLEILNKKLTESESELKELNSTKDKFFSIISHDIQSPLNSFRHITGYLTSSYNILNDDDKYSYIHEINKSTEQLHDLFQNLLQWSVSQRNMIKFNPKEIDLSVIVFKIIALLQPVADKKGIGIVSEVEENTLAYCDINMILTVLRNLVSNAIKFSNQGDYIIIKSSAENRFVEISVNDTGIGINDEDVKKLFRIDTDHKTIGSSKEKGTGLGLILCREFVEKNGGRIWAESQLGKGSTFAFSLHKNKIN